MSRNNNNTFFLFIEIKTVQVHITDIVGQHINNNNNNNKIIMKVYFRPTMKTAKAHIQST